MNERSYKKVQSADRPVTQSLFGTAAYTMLRSLFIFSCLLLAVTGQDIDCSQDSDCPDDKPYCNNVGQCSWCMPPDYPPPFEDCKYFVDLNGWPYFLPHKYSKFWLNLINNQVNLTLIFDPRLQSVLGV